MANVIKKPVAKVAPKEEKKLEVKHADKCVACDGRGLKDTLTLCPTCNGTGK